MFDTMKKPIIVNASTYLLCLLSVLQFQDEFISMIGHELRAPLNAIIQLSSAMLTSLSEFLRRFV